MIILFEIIDDRKVYIKYFKVEKNLINLLLKKLKWGKC